MPKPAIVISAALVTLGIAQCGPEDAKRTSSLPPRKVIVGTAMQAYWGEYPGLEKRLEQLGGVVDEMALQSKKTYGRSLDLAVLPEMAVTGEISADVVAHSLPLKGPVMDAFARKAREHRCYIIVPMHLLEGTERRKSSNAAVLIDRRGELAGIYRKMHPAVQTGSDSFEGGITPGDDAPVFACDFGKLGIQICFDMEFDYGWNQLARQGADLVAWPTQSPQTAHPAARAMRYGYYIVSSTWRDNASIFEPTGKIISQIRAPERTLVQEVDLSYAILPWSPGLRKGAALREKYGEKVGFRYYEDEDLGIFWSNDPRMPIRQAVRSLGLSEAGEELERIQKLYRKAGAR